VAVFFYVAVCCSASSVAAEKLSLWFESYPTAIASI